MAKIVGEVNEEIGLSGLSEDEEKMVVLAMSTLHDEGLSDIEEALLDKPISEPEKAG